MYDSCYESVNSSKGFNWPDAQSACAANGTEGALVTIDEPEEDSYLFDTYWKHFNGESWLGAKYGDGINCSSLCFFLTYCLFCIP